MDLRDHAFKYHKIGDADVIFQPAHEDHTSATIQYYGFLSRDINGAWVIMKCDMTTTVYAWTYCIGTSGYSTAWTNRATNTYVAYNAL